MMKITKKIALALLLAVSLAICFSLLIKTTQTRSWKIGLSFNRTLSVLHDSTRFNYWLIDTVHNPNLVVKQVHVNPLIAAFNLSENGAEQFVYWTASPAENNTYFSTVTLHYKTNWWNRIFKSNPLQQYAHKASEQLVGYIENVNAFYGYPIETTTVSDSTYLFGAITTSNASKYNKTAELINNLKKYANKTGAAFTGKSILNIERISEDSVVIKASIAINNPAAIPETGNFIVKRMPYGKNLLKLSYEGPYNEVQNAISALERFRDDHNFNSMAIPYYDYPATDTVVHGQDTVRISVYYPVF